MTSAENDGCILVIFLKKVGGPRYMSSIGRTEASTVTKHCNTHQPHPHPHPTAATVGLEIDRDSKT